RAPATLTERYGQSYEAVQTPARGSPVRVSSHLLRRIGVVDPESIESYQHEGGFAALGRAREVGADAVIRMVTEAGLLGRGGAASRDRRRGAPRCRRLHLW